MPHCRKKQNQMSLYDLDILTKKNFLINSYRDLEGVALLAKMQANGADSTNPG